jgi:hypothetical protein
VSETVGGGRKGKENESTVSKYNVSLQVEDITIYTESY